MWCQLATDFPHLTLPSGRIGIVQQARRGRFVLGYGPMITGSVQVSLADEPSFGRGLGRMRLLDAALIRDWSAPAKLQFHADPMGRLESGVAAAGGSGQTRTLEIPTRGCSARGDQVRAARNWRAASVLPRDGAGTGRFARPGTGVLWPASGGGIPEHPRRLGHSGGSRRAPGNATTARGAATVAPAVDRGLPRR